MRGVPDGLFVILSVVAAGIVIWGIIDAAIRPTWAWQRAGRNKVAWVVLQAAGLLFCFIVGIVSAIIYLTTIRPELARHQSGGYQPPPPSQPPW